MENNDSCIFVSINETDRGINKSIASIIKLLQSLKVVLIYCRRI